MSARLGLVVMMMGQLAIAGTRDDKARVELPKGGRYAEALLTSRWFSNFELIGPIGGPSKGYELALQVWPKGPTILIEGNDGKDELDEDPLFRALKKPRLELVAAADGHAVAWTIDGALWHAAYLDGPRVFLCRHDPVDPAAIPPTRDAVKKVLTTDAHARGPRRRPVRATLSADGAQELRGALAFALRPGGDEALARLARAWLDDPKNAEVIGEAGLRETAAESGERPVEPMPSRPAETACVFGHSELSLLPEKLTEELVLSRLAIPQRATAATCAAWGELDQRLKAGGTARGAKPASGNPRANSQRSACASALMASALVSMKWYGSPSTAPYLEAYEARASRCGHVDVRDPACEREVREAVNSEWLTQLEARRRAECPRSNEFFALARECVAVNVGAGADASSGEGEQIWAAISLFVATAHDLYCPAKPLEFPALIQQ